jgi:hypothetical protein
VNDPLSVIFAVLFPVLLVGWLVLLALLWQVGGGRLPRIVPRPEPRHEPVSVEGHIVDDVWMVSVWLVATGLLLGLGFVAAFVAVHTLLFTLGPDAAMAGLVTSGVFLAAIPVGVAVVVRRQARQR